MKLMDIDQDQLGIPETDYESRVRMPAGEFARICRELASLGESVRIDVNKEGVRFNSEGDVANGSVLLKPTAGAGHYTAKKEEDEDDEPKISESSSSKKKKKVVEDEEEEETEDAPKVKKEKTDEDVEMEEDDGGSIKEVEVDEDEEEEIPAPKKKGKKRVVEDEEEEEPAEDEDEEEELPSKKRKRKSTDSGSKKVKKVKKGGDDDDKAEVAIQVVQAVSLSFSLKYLINFSKASTLCSHVELCLSADVPLLVSRFLMSSDSFFLNGFSAPQCAFEFEQGHIKYYLAPKIGDE